MSMLCIHRMFGPVKHSTMSRIFSCSRYSRNTGSRFMSCNLFTDFLSFTSYITRISFCGTLLSTISSNLKNKGQNFSILIFVYVVFKLNFFILFRQTRNIVTRFAIKFAWVTDISEDSVFVIYCTATFQIFRTNIREINRL